MLLVPREICACGAVTTTARLSFDTVVVVSGSLIVTVSRSITIGLRFFLPVVLISITDRPLEI